MSADILPGLSWGVVMLATVSPRLSWGVVVLATVSPGLSWGVVMLATVSPGLSWGVVMPATVSPGLSWGVVMLATVSPGLSWDVVTLATVSPGLSGLMTGCRVARIVLKRTPQGPPQPSFVPRIRTEACILFPFSSLRYGGSSYFCARIRQNVLFIWKQTI